MRLLLVALFFCVSSSAFAKDRPPPSSSVSPSSSSSSESSSSVRQRQWDAMGYRIFGGYLGATVGGLLVAGAFATGHEAAPVATGWVGFPMTLASMHTLHQTATRRHWNPRVGSALAGMYPGFGYGALLGTLIAGQAELDGRARRGTILGVAGAFSILTMGIWSRILGRNLKRAFGLLHLLPLVAGLVLLPYAALNDKPRSIGWAMAGAGAIALTVAAFNTEF